MLDRDKKWVMYQEVVAIEKIMSNLELIRIGQRLKHGGEGRDIGILWI